MNPDRPAVMNPPVPPAKEGGLWLRFGLTTVAIIVLVISLAVVVFLQEKQRYRERANNAAQNLVSLLDQQISDAFGKIDVVLQSCVYYYNHQLSHGQLDAADINAYLTYQESLLPELDGLRIIDRDGIVRYGRGVPSTDPVNLSDREMYIRARQQGDKGLIIYGPIFARIAHQWVITVARRLEAPDVSFAGVIYANLATESFNKNLALAAVGDQGAATLRTLDLALVHRYPSTKNGVGRKDVSAQLREAIRLNPSGGAYIATTALDGIERSNAFRKLQQAPFYVIVGLATGDYLGGWKQNVWLVSTLAGLATLITILAAILIYRAHRALRSDIANRIRISAELEQSMAECSRLNTELEARAHELEQMNATLERMVEDRTAKLTAVNHELEHIARCDPLTKLGNRLFADERLREEFLRMKNSGIVFSVLLIDIDHFKRVNDTYGHEAGDSVLAHIATILGNNVRASDFVARFGGEEFLVILPATQLDSAQKVAEKIRSAVADAPVPMVGHITLSIGVAMASETDLNKEDVVRQADHALYRAKSAGRNQVCIQLATGNEG